MHDRLAEILDEEVIGEVTQVGNVFFDVGLGRVCLDRLDPRRVEDYVARLRKAFGAIDVEDHLHLTDPDEIVRGMVGVTLRPAPGRSPYLLQITSRPVLAYYEQRFMLEPGVLGDLMGTLCNGVAHLVRSGEAPLGILGGCDGILEQHRNHLDAVIKAAVNGEAYDVQPDLEQMLERTREAWRLIPFPLRQKLRPLSTVKTDRIAPHDPVLRRTVLLATNLVDGKITYQYIHQHNPLEEYEQVLTWMTEVHQAMMRTYPPPLFAAAMARASSVERLMDYFPGFRRIAGDVLEGEDA